MLERLTLWLDPVARSGPEAMAVDEWLVEAADAPVLRVYGWRGEWGSIGYFGKAGEALETIPGLRWVRRWTGGGLVDHRADWTYTLVVPAGFALAGSKGAESYRWIHSALGKALAEEGVESRLSGGGEVTGKPMCFENPVGYDLVAPDGGKLAGAGQRRTKMGLLHQGSVALRGGGGRGGALAGHLAGRWQAGEFDPPSEEVAFKAARRYEVFGGTGEAG